MTGLAMLVDQLFSSAPGGMGTYVRELVPALSHAEPSLEITLFHARHETAPPDVDGWMRGYRVEQLNASIRRLYPSWATARRPRLPPELASMDLLHSPVHAAVPPKGPQQRLIVTVHDLAFLSHPELFPRPWRLMYRAGLARLARSA